MRVGVPGEVAAVPEERRTVQTARPRDFGLLILVVGLFLILFLVTALVGPAPA
jgi:hypothetical protein